MGRWRFQVSSNSCSCQKRCEEIKFRVEEIISEEINSQEIIFFKKLSPDLKKLFSQEINSEEIIKKVHLYGNSNNHHPSGLM